MSTCVWIRRWILEGEFWRVIFRRWFFHLFHLLKFTFGNFFESWNQLWPKLGKVNFEGWILEKFTFQKSPLPTLSKVDFNFEKSWKGWNFKGDFFNSFFSSLKFTFQNSPFIKVDLNFEKVILRRWILSKVDFNFEKGDF